MPPNWQGFRGAGFLGAGEFQVSNQIQLRAGGIVLRGAAHGTTGTVPGPHRSGTARHSPRLRSPFAPDPAGQCPGDCQCLCTGGRSRGHGKRPHRTLGGRPSAGGAAPPPIVTPGPENGPALLSSGDVQPWSPANHQGERARRTAGIDEALFFPDAPMVCAIGQRCAGGTPGHDTWSGCIRGISIEEFTSIFHPARRRGSRRDLHSWASSRTCLGSANHRTALRFCRSDSRLGRQKRHRLGRAAALTPSRRSPVGAATRPFLTMRSHAGFATVPHPGIGINLASNLPRPDPTFCWTAGARVLWLMPVRTIPGPIPPIGTTSRSRNTISTSKIAVTSPEAPLGRCQLRRLELFGPWLRAPKPSRRTQLDRRFLGNRPDPATSTLAPTPRAPAIIMATLFIREACTAPNSKTAWPPPLRVIPEYWLGQPAVAGPGHPSSDEPLAGRRLAKTGLSTSRCQSPQHSGRKPAPSMHPADLQVQSGTGLGHFRDRAPLVCAAFGPQRCASSAAPGAARIRCLSPSGSAGLPALPEL